MVADVLGDLTGVNALYTNHLLALHPVVKRLLSIPVTVEITLVANNQGTCLGVLALSVCRQSELVSRHGLNTIVTYDRIGHNNELAA